MRQITKNEIYNHYIALDWSKVNFAVSSMRDNSVNIKTEEHLPDIKILKNYFKKFTGKKILTIEESTSTHWLYVELKETVDKILICDPYRNSLLKDGPKNDKIDSRDLCTLLRNGSLKEVFHTMDKSYEIRKLSSSYEDFVKASVSLKNQRSSMFLSEGKDHKKEKILTESQIKKFVTEKQNSAIEHIAQIRNEYEKMYRKLAKEHEAIRLMTKISGIAEKTAVTIFAVVIDPTRFKNKYKYYAYCGLVKYSKDSGGRSYGKRKTRHSKILKRCYKTAANAAIGGNNDIREYFEYLLQNNMNIEDARNEIARYIAKSSLAVMKHKTDSPPSFVFQKFA